MIDLFNPPSGETLAAIVKKSAVSIWHSSNEHADAFEGDEAGDGVYDIGGEDKREASSHRRLKIISLVRLLPRSKAISTAEVASFCDVPAQVASDDVRRLIKDRRVHGRIVGNALRIWGIKT